MSEEHDPTYVPASSILDAVGLTAKKTDEAWFNVIRNNTRKSLELEVQNAVATYTLNRRGHAHEAIAAQVGVDVRTVKRWVVQGQALLRTVVTDQDMDAAARTLSACKLVDASLSLVDAATKTAASAEEKLDRLETAALTEYVRKNFVNEDESPLADDVVADIVTSLPEQAQANTGSDDAVSARDMADAIPNVAETFAIQRKVTGRNSDPDGGTGPKQLEYHLNLALKDMLAIAKDAEADYVPTPHDYAALFRLCDAIGVDLVMGDDMRAAVESLVEVAW